MQNRLTSYKGIKKVDYMPEAKISQLQYERDALNRTLAFMIDENVHLKNRISETLKNDFDNKLLDELENFQNRFIKEDELIGFLRKDLVELNKLLVREKHEDGKIVKEIGRKLKKLRDNIITAERQFGTLKSEFVNYLSENI